MKNSFFKKVIGLFFIVFLSLSFANVAFQGGWDRQPISPQNINDEDELRVFLNGVDCEQVKEPARNIEHSAVVARGLHDNPLHYTVRVYACPTNEL